MKCEVSSRDSILHRKYPSVNSAKEAALNKKGTLPRKRAESASIEELEMESCTELHLEDRSSAKVSTRNDVSAGVSDREEQRIRYATETTVDSVRCGRAVVSLGAADLDIRVVEDVEYLSRKHQPASLAKLEALLTTDIDTVLRPVSESISADRSTGRGIRTIVIHRVAVSIGTDDAVERDTGTEPYRTRELESPGEEEDRACDELVSSVKTCRTPLGSEVVSILVEETRRISLVVIVGLAP